eukprot:TRINITY_DN5854_c0_g1_i2.p1 TRINITY_DN5854_c0_g1~~TRINITY_DN5854_c0_g1_i2.p1  ORF type:complete len:282 (+),score=26.32 TRINITY_DN5854_c0_g1_i2:751-1596(+)
MAQPYQLFLCGGVSGALSKTLTAPLTRLNIMLQIKKVSGENISSLNLFKRTINEEGVLSLWRGNGVNVLKIIPASAINLGTYHVLIRYLKSENNELPSTTQSLFAGGVAGALSMSATYPLDVLRTRMSLQLTSHVHNHLKNIFMQGGWYRGLGVGLSEVVPNLAINYAIFESAKAYLSSYRDMMTQLGIVMSASSISAFISCTTTYPLVVVRRNMQVLKSPEENKMTGLQVCRQIWKGHRFGGFFAGIVPFYLQIVPQIAISFSVFDFMQNKFTALNKYKI